MTIKAKRKGLKMTEKVAKVYEALHQVVSELDVEKDSVLPSNMSGAAYRTTEAITAEVRTLFEKNNLILIPSEKVVDTGHIEFNKRLNYYTVIEGKYEIVSLEDGSSVTISGTGRGQSVGTAVDANIASTFAFKNALQRLFLIADRNEEDRAHRDGTPGPTKAERQAELARNAGKNSASRGPARAKNEFQVKVKEKFIDTGVVTAEQANEEIKKLRAKGDKNPFETLLNSLEKGELPDA